MTEMNDVPIGQTQRLYARLAGFMYFFNYVTAVFGFVVTGKIVGSGDFTARAQRVAASQELYRVALTSLLVSWVLIVLLAFSLYVALEPVNKRLAQIALFMELGQSVAGAVTIMFSFATLQVYISPASGAFQNSQSQALVAAFQSASNNGFQIAMTFLGVGSTLFFYLWYKSRYLPRPLAGLGVVGSVIMLMISLGSLIFPAYGSTFQYGWAPIGVAEVTTAFWLMLAGIGPALMLKPATA